MKKILLILLSLIIFNLSALAETKNIRVNNDIFELQYATIHQKNGSIMNEYVRTTENLNNWTDIITAFHFPTLDSDMYYKIMYNKVTTQKNYKLINSNESEKTLSYIIAAPYGDGFVFEYNIMRIMAHPNGTDALQWGHRYTSSKSKEDMREALYEAFKYDKSYAYILSNISMPELRKTPYEKK